MKKAMESSIDRAHSSVHPSMKKAMKRSVHQEVLASSSSWWTAPGAYDEVSAFMDFLGWWPSVPVNKISEGSSADRANDSTCQELAADSMKTETSTMTDAEYCDLLDQELGREESTYGDLLEQELGGDRKSVV